MSVEARVFRVFVFICIGQGRPELACRQTGSSFGEKRKKKRPVLFDFWITAKHSAWVAHWRRPPINLSQRTMWYSDTMISKRVYCFSTAGKMSSSKLLHILVDRIWFLTGSCTQGLTSLLTEAMLNSKLHRPLHGATHNLTAGFPQRRQVRQWERLSPKTTTKVLYHQILEGNPLPVPHFTH